MQMYIRYSFLNGLGQAKILNNNTIYTILDRLHCKCCSVLQFTFFNKCIHRQIHLYTMLMCIKYAGAKVVFRKIGAEHTSIVLRISHIDTVCAAIDYGFQIFYILCRNQKFRNLHYISTPF